MKYRKSPDHFIPKELYKGFWILPDNNGRLDVTDSIGRFFGNYATITECKSMIDRRAEERRTYASPIHS